MLPELLSFRVKQKRGNLLFSCFSVNKWVRYIKTAKKYFNKDAINLTRQEAAMIAACLPNPKRYKVKPASAWLMRRAGAIQRQMDNLHTDPDIQKVTGISP